MWSDSDKIGTSDLVLSSSLDCSALERAELSLKRCRFFLLCPLPEVGGVRRFSSGSQAPLSGSVSETPTEWYM